MNLHDDERVQQNKPLNSNRTWLAITFRINKSTSNVHKMTTQRLFCWTRPMRQLSQNFSVKIERVVCSRLNRHERAHSRKFALFVLLYYRIPYCISGQRAVESIVIGRITAIGNANWLLVIARFYVNINRDCFAMSVATAIARPAFHRQQYHQRQLNIDSAARVMSNMAAESKIAFRLTLDG